jgi:RsiW-degrading membrane proteinase PrsW (M82 family)
MLSQAIVLSRIFTQTSVLVLLVFFYLFNFSTVPFSVLLSSFFSSSRVAGVVGSLAFSLLGYILAPLIQKGETDGDGAGSAQPAGA